MESNDTKQNVKANIQDTEDFILDQQHMIFAVSFTRTKYGKIQHDKGFCQRHVTCRPISGTRRVLSLTQQLMIFAVSFPRTKYGKIQHDNGFCQCCVFHIVSLNSVVGYCWHFESFFASSVDVHCRFRFRFSMGGFPKWHRRFLWLSAAMGLFCCGRGLWGRL